jgi:thiol-disulfide isomerase/thioredoxin
LRKALLSFVCVALSVAPLLLADSFEHLRKAPELSFSVPGKGQQTLDQYRGKVVALEFIYTTCPHCQAASHLMTKLQSEYGNRGFQVIDVAVNQNADLLVENFAKDFGVNFPVGWTTPAQMTQFMGFNDGRFVVPQLVLVDRQGTIHYQTPALSNDDTWSKLMDEKAVRQHIEELLGMPAHASAEKTRFSSTKSATNHKSS